MIEADLKTVDDYEAHVKAFLPRGFPFVTKQTLNQTAWHGREVMKREIKERFIERNKWTQSSIRVNQTRSLDIDFQKSEFGSTEEYMVKQEFGGTVRGRGGSHSIPTGYSAGQEGTTRRTKLPRKPNKMRNIRLRRLKVPKTASKSLTNFLTVREAAENGVKYIFLDLGRRRGVFRVLGGKRKPRVRMVADLSRRQVRITPTRTLEPATNAALRKMPEFYEDALIFQLRRAKIIK